MGWSVSNSCFPHHQPPSLRLPLRVAAELIGELLKVTLPLWRSDAKIEILVRQLLTYVLAAAVGHQPRGR